MWSTAPSISRLHHHTATTISGATAAVVAGNNGNDSTASPLFQRLSALAVAAATATVVAYNNSGEESLLGKINKAHCMTITAVVGKDDFDARNYLLDGLEQINTKGYDGAGIATMASTGGTMAIVKKSSPNNKIDPIQMVRDSSRSMHGHSIGIGHTRWATHGSITDRNAHPHLDASGKIAVVHNGSIFNRQELRKELKALGYKFDGQTDTEVIAKLIGHYYQGGKVDIRVATEKAMKRCEGAWGMVVMCSDNPEELIVICNGSPLYIGVGDNGTFVASNPSAFKGQSGNFIKLQDREVATITADGRNLDLTKLILAKEEDDESNSPAPYPHWFIKEVMEQPQSIGRALGFGGRLYQNKATLGGLEEKIDQLKNIDHLSVVGCGSSFNAATYGTKLLRHMGVFANVNAMDANSTEDSDFRIPSSDSSKSGLIVISQSGETKELVDVVQSAQRRDVPVVSLVNVVGSTIANLTKCGVYTFAGQENAVASTKSFTTQVVCMALVALWFRQTKAKEMGLPTSNEQIALGEALMRLPITFGMLMRTQAACKKAAKKIVNKEHCFVLGKGYGEPIAMEGALKLKEVGYLHAEGYSGGALKHGPFAMIEDDTNGKQGATPIIMLVLDDMHAHHMRTACEEVKARGAQLIIITDNKKLADGLDDDPIIIPPNGPLTALGAVVPLQMIAYELAMLKDNNPDAPRYLLKSYPTA